MPLKPDEVKAILEAEKKDALAGENASKLSEERTKAMEYYLGDMTQDMPTLPDRSKAVSTDVADTVEGLMPSLMEIFFSGEEVVKFEPVGPEDEEAADQETDYVNHVFMQKNPGFLVGYSFIKDALLQKNGIVKVWWEDTEEEEREHYRGLTEDALMLIKSDPDIEVVSDEQYPAPLPVEPQMGPDGQPIEAAPSMLHDIEVVRRVEYGCARVEAVPPEEFGISRRAKNTREADYCFHETTKTVNDLIAQGFDPEQVKKLPTGEPDETGEESSRNTVDDTDDPGLGGVNEPTRPIKVTEHYCRLDYEEDGRARLYRITTATDASTILIRKEGKKPAIDPVDQVPFASMTPVIQTHRFFGRSVADLVMDIQRQKTALIRALLDNIYLANNQRMEVAESGATANTIDDILNNRPGGMIRTKVIGSIAPVLNTPIGEYVYPGLQYLDSVKEWRTGVTRQGQGIDAEALQNQTAEAVNKVYTAAQAKMKLIARIFAETGIRDLFSLLHSVIRKNDQQENTVRLRNKWVKVDPRNWKTRKDMTISVGLGSGGKEEQLKFLMALLGVQKEAIQAPQLKLVQPQNLYNTLKRLVELGGLKSVEPYFTDPQSQPEVPPQPDPKMVEAQGKLQLQQAEAQSQMQIEQMKLQMEDAREREKMQMEFRLRQEQMQAELMLKQQSTFIQAQTQVATAPVRMGGRVG